MFLLLLSTVKSSRHFFTLFDDRVYCLLCHNVWTKGSTHSCELPMTHEDNFKKAFLEKNSSRYRKNFIVIFESLYSPIAIICYLTIAFILCFWISVYEQQFMNFFFIKENNKDPSVSWSENFHVGTRDIMAASVSSVHWKSNLIKLFDIDGFSFCSPFCSILFFILFNFVQITDRYFLLCISFL